ncbi:MAG: acylphosphatase [Methanosarcinales archaeon]|nr:acylphosphatase [Methanosarcinales archaeon]
MKAMQTRTEIIAKGDVQRVGYRDAVERTARKMKLTGNVSNIKPYDVRIICEGDKTTIDSFIEQIRIKEYPIDVEHLDISFQEATGEFDYFEILRGDMAEELGECLDIANVKMTQMIQKQDITIEKMDYNTSILKDNNSMLKNNNSMLKENTSVLKEFKNETGENLSRLTNIMEKHDNDARERIASLTMEVSDIKKRLSRVESAIS